MRYVCVCVLKGVCVFHGVFEGGFFNTNTATNGTLKRLFDFLTHTLFTHTPTFPKQKNESLRVYQKGVFPHHY